MKSYPKIIALISMSLLFTVLSCRKSDYEVVTTEEVITDNGGGTGTTTWTKNTSYLIEGFVFVNDGQVLTIEAGTVIRAKTGQGASSSALIVARGGTIIASGTSSEPIIFTVEGDDLEGSVPAETQGLWGGLILLGRAPLNLAIGESHIEGIPITEPRGVYGGTLEDDNSGILQYISIRHAGTNIGEGNEINGLTFGGVGSKTIVDHIEVVSCADDGVEFFGGNVNCKYMVVAFCGDDAFDYDIGYRGYGQFWLAIQDPSQGDKLIECNGGFDPVLGQPYSMPLIYNATLIGRGQGPGKEILNYSWNAAGIIANSIMVFQDKGCLVQYVEGSQDSYSQLESGNLNIKNNVFFGVGNQTPAGIFTVYADNGIDVSQQNAAFTEYFDDVDNRIADPGITRDNGKYNVIPTGNVFDVLASYPDPWFDAVEFKGAFYTYNWTNGWTLVHSEGYILD